MERSYADDQDSVGTVVDGVRPGETGDIAMAGPHAGVVDGDRRAAQDDAILELRAIEHPAERTPRGNDSAAARSPSGAPPLAPAANVAEHVPRYQTGSWFPTANDC